MERKNLKKVGVIILIVIVALILVENAIKGIIFAKNKISSKIAEKKDMEIYVSSDEFKADEALEKIVKEIQEMILNDNMDALYLHSYPAYMDAKFHNDQEAFAEYIHNFYQGLVSIEYQEFQDSNHAYYTSVLVEKENNNFIYHYLIFTDPSQESLSYQVVLENCYSIDPIDRGTYNTELGVRMEVKYALSKEAALQYAVDFTNMNQEETSLEVKNAVISTTDNNGFEGKDTTSSIVKLKPGETTRRMISFENNSAKGTDIYDYPVSTLNVMVETNEGKKSDILMVNFSRR